MHRYLTIFMVFAIIAAAALGCGKKETPPEAEMPPSMSVSIEGTTTNMVTKAGTPVQAGSVPAEIANTEEAPPTAGYIPPTPEEIQQALKNAGFYTGTVDGKIGPATKKSVTEFQQQNGLTADGKAGKKTWEKLREYLNQQ